MRVLLSIALPAVISPAGQAQDLPDQVAAAVKTAQAECTGGKVATGKNFITRRLSQLSCAARQDVDGGDGARP